MVTRKEVARRARVSVGTVSNVINHKDIVQPKTVERVRQA
ncbi:MAG: LacI family DNA-binding transcriptional regulator, partial [Clostridiales bacterium]|nr:LacI family DNA-binding transcriptional regulator [Clostridiales bacterium]